MNLNQLTDEEKKRIEEEMKKIRDGVTEEHTNLVDGYAKELSELVTEWGKKEGISGTELFVVAEALNFVAIGMLDTLNQQLDPNYNKTVEKQEEISKDLQTIVNKHPKAPFVAIASAMLQLGNSIYSTSLTHAKVETAIKEKLEKGEENGGNSSTNS